MKRGDMIILLIAMVVIAVGALLVSHYAFGGKSSTNTTTTTGPPALAKAYRACVADGSTIETAIAAFKAENPDQKPSESTLVSGGQGGPYLQSWTYNPEFYSFTLANGVLYLRAGTSGFLTELPSVRIRFIGSSSCLKIGL
jgi:hypothetical protein